MRPVVVVSRYAKAFGDVVGWGLDIREELRSDLENFMKFYLLVDVRGVLDSEVMPYVLKKDLVDYALLKLKTSENIKGLVYTLLNAKRINLFSDIINKYYAMVDVKNSIIQVEVTTKTKKDINIDLLKGALKSIFGGEQVNITFKEKPDILSGVILKSQNKRLDLSLRSKLEKLTSYLELEA